MKPGSVLAEKVKTGNSRGQVEFSEACSFANPVLLIGKVGGAKPVFLSSLARHSCRIGSVNSIRVSLTSVLNQRADGRSSHS
jgi:hypothetical protein